MTLEQTMTSEQTTTPEQIIIDKINTTYEQCNVPRRRLGLSQAGHACKRHLWYAHNGYDAAQPEGRVLRLFQLGNILEDQTIADIKAADFVHHSDQLEVKFEDGDVTLIGHIDGIVEGVPGCPEVPHLFEHKTCSLKKYKELLKCGSYAKWNPVYAFQVQAYMLGLGLKNAIVFVYCKDNSELYVERITLNTAQTVDKLVDIFAAIRSENPPERKCPNPAWFESKFCPYRNVCWGLEK